MRTYLASLAKSFLLLAGVLATFAFAGCASPSGGDDISRQPWSRPEAWEGQMGLGGFSGTR